MTCEKIMLSTVVLSRIWIQYHSVGSKKDMMIVMSVESPMSIKPNSPSAITGLTVPKEHSKSSELAD